jgi:vacuolar-type H+-ATPase subunit C/Vma6
MIKLTDFVQEVEESVFEIDIDVAYPVYLQELGLGTDAFNVEVARRCLTQDMIQEFGGSILIRLKSVDKRWKLSDLPGGEAAGGRGAAQFATFYTILKEGR